MVRLRTCDLDIISNTVLNAQARVVQGAYSNNNRGGRGDNSRGRGGRGRGYRDAFNILRTETRVT